MKREKINMFSPLSPCLSLSGLQAYRNPAELQQSQRGEDTFPVPRKDRRQGGPEQAESEAGVSGKGLLSIEYHRFI